MHTLKAIRDSERGITKCVVIEWHYTRLITAWPMVQSCQLVCVNASWIGFVYLSLKQRRITEVPKSFDDLTMAQFHLDDV